MFFHGEMLLRRAPHLIGALVALLAMLFVTRRQGFCGERVLLWFSLLALLAHLATADIGWVFRYEAYLMALCAVSVVGALPLVPSGGAIQLASGIVILTSIPGVVRMAQAFAEMPHYAHAIYSQQIQMARFVAQYYARSSIVLNDIGAVDYMADVHLVDLAGLANSQVLRHKLDGTYTTAAIAAEISARRSQIAIVYDDWFSERPSTSLGGPPLPASWVRVGRWRLPGKQYVGSNTVSFSAVQPEEVAPLHERFEEFGAELPSYIQRLESDEPCSPRTPPCGEGQR